MQASTLIKLGEVFHAADGLTYFGDLSGEATHGLDEVSRTFNRAGIKLEISQNITELMWSKLVANAAINPLTALLGIKNSGLLSQRWRTHVMSEVISEGVNVAKAKGVKLGIRKTAQEAMSIAKLTGSNKSSMLQDIEKRRRTEIDSINGAISRIGKEVHVETPVNNLLTRLVREVEGGEIRSAVREKATTLLKSI
jgi:2-dehydropantoate 2-reductase